MQNGGVVYSNNVDNNNKNKGKAIQLVSFSDDEQLEESASDCYDTTNNDESDPGSSNSLLDPDSLIYEEDDDDYFDDQYEMEYEEEEEADDYVSKYQTLFDANEMDIPAGVEVTMDCIIYVDPQAPAPASSSVLLPTQGNPKGLLYSARPRVEEVISTQSTCRVKRNMEDYLGKYLFFKRFDIVEDLVDHHYASKGTASKKHSKEWAKRIQEEWIILENDLPEMIFVRAYESRMDLLRAVIIGADGTPYHDGLFFFDIFFPDTYPSVPPLVHYQSGGLRINPNLYNCGKVCLSLLGTWIGSQKETWIPNASTMLQVLVSIQGLILNQKPYFNEPGYASSARSVTGERRSKAYSENTFLLSLKTMVYNMRRPPKYFEDFSYGHFFSCAHEVLKACSAYRNGAPVASLVRGKVKKEEESSSERCSEKFRGDVDTFVDTVLLKEFILLGVLGLEPEEEEKPSETNVAESSSSNGRKRERVSSN